MAVDAVRVRARRRRGSTGAVRGARFRPNHLQSPLAAAALGVALDPPRHERVRQGRKLRQCSRPSNTSVLAEVHEHRDSAQHYSPRIALSRKPSDVLLDRRADPGSHEPVHSSGLEVVFKHDNLPSARRADRDCQIACGCRYVPLWSVNGVYACIRSSLASHNRVRHITPSPAPSASSASVPRQLDSADVCLCRGATVCRRWFSGRYSTHRAMREPQSTPRRRRPRSVGRRAGRSRPRSRRRRTAPRP